MPYILFFSVIEFIILVWLIYPTVEDSLPLPALSILFSSALAFTETQRKKPEAKS